MLINNTDWVAVSEFCANNVCRTQKHIPEIQLKKKKGHIRKP